MTSKRSRIQLLLLDDHLLVREGLRALLERESDMEIVGEAGRLRDAVALEVEPDVIVADLMLPDARGADVVRGVREAFPRAEVLVLTMVDNPSDVHLTFAAGGRGYLLKEAASTEVVEAIRRVASGEDYLQPAMGAAIASMRTAPEGVHVSATTRLSARELEVLRLIAMGHTNAEIAAVLHLSLRTVEGHRSSVSRKLDLRTRAELVRYATRQGLLHND